MVAPDYARDLLERSVGCDPIRMIRVYDLTLDVIEDFTASLVDAVDARGTIEAFLLQMDEEGMNAGCPGAGWAAHGAVDAHDLLVRISP